MILFDPARQAMTLEQELARGGEGVVYTVKGQPGLLAKVYTPAPREGQEDKLRWMRSHPPQDPPGSVQHQHPAIAWPRELLYDGQARFQGYLMPRVENAVSALLVFNPRVRAQRLPSFDRRYQHRAARNLAAAVSVLHDGNYIIGDLNESNVLVTPSALVTLIDVDSFQVQEPRNGRIIVYPPHVGKAEYTPRELQGQSLGAVWRMPQHDAFALGVLIFQLLMEGNHPFRARWLRPGDPAPLAERIREGWFPYDPRCSDTVAPPPGIPALDTLHPDLVALVQRCFIDGHQHPNQRPTAREWETSLEKAEQALVQCSAGHIYSGHLRACPLCGSASARRPKAAGPVPVNGKSRNQRAPATAPQTQAAAAKWGAQSIRTAKGASTTSTSPTYAPPKPATKPGASPSSSANSASGSQSGTRGGTAPRPGQSQPSGQDDLLVLLIRRALAAQAARPTPSSTSGRIGHLVVQMLAGSMGLATASKTAPATVTAPQPATITPAAASNTRSPFAPVRRPSRIDVALLVPWMALSILAWAVVWTILVGIRLDAQLEPAVASALSMLVSGLLVGGAQWLVLITRSGAGTGGRRTAWWVLAVAAGWATAGYLYGIWPGLTERFIPPVTQIGGGMARLALVGLLVGLAQWPVARQFLPWQSARRWIAVCGLVFAVALALAAAAGAFGITRGWFTSLTLKMGGQAGFSIYDLALALIWGAALGLAEYPLLRGNKRAGWWPVVTCIGLLAGAAAFEGLLRLLEQVDQAGIGGFVASGGTGTEALAWLMLGVGLGLGQWLVLRRAVRRAGRWVLLTTAGTLLGWAAATLMVTQDWVLMGAAVAGVVAMLPPWAAARAEFRHARWLPAWGAGIWILTALCLAPWAGVPMVGAAVVPMVLTLLLALVPGAVFAYRR